MGEDQNFMNGVQGILDNMEAGEFADENQSGMPFVEEEEQEDVIEMCQKFLKRSSDRFSDDIDEQERALEIAGGKFWNDEQKKRWAFVDDDGEELLPVVSYNNISPQVNAIASPFARSGFHANVVRKESPEMKMLQNHLSKVEASNNSKTVLQQAMTRGVTCKAGYVVLGTMLDVDRVIPNVEFVSSQKMVAFDPDCITPDGHDAEEGALVSYISLKKARREYGDVVSADYPKTQPRLSFVGIDAWADKTDKIQLVKYFRKKKVYDEVTGKEVTRVIMHTICGDMEVSEPVTLTTDIIPIVRFAGYDDYDSQYGTVYTGYVQKMLSHIEQMSLALTMQATRMRRCSNVRFVTGKTAMEGCEDYFLDFEKGSALGLVFNDKNGAAPPTIMNDTFPTNDISTVLQEGRQAMQDCSGVNLAGINTTERTAYEVMQQQVNNESNVQELYLHAEAACHTIAKIMIGILNNGVVPDFTLEGGPAVITTQMKERAEIQAIASMVAPEHQELLAIRMAETITSSVGKEIAQDLKANCQLKLTEGQDVGSLINAIEQLKAVHEQTMQQLEEVSKENEQLKKDNYSLEVQMMNNRESMQLERDKFNAQMNKDEAQLAVENAEAAKKLAQEDDKIQLQAQRQAADNRRQAAKLFIDTVQGRR